MDVWDKIGGVFDNLVDINRILEEKGGVGEDDDQNGVPQIHASQFVFEEKDEDDAEDGAADGQKQKPVGYKPSLLVDVSDQPAGGADNQQMWSASGMTPNSSRTPHVPTNIFVAGIPPSWDDVKLKETFSKFGDVVSVRVVKERHFGFVMYRIPGAAHEAINAMHLSRPCPQSNSILHVSIAMHDEGAGEDPNERIFVRGLPQWATKEMLKQCFEEFGTVVECAVLINPMGQCKGSGFIQFSTTSEATAAVEKQDDIRLPNWDSPLHIKYSETLEVRHQRQERNRNRQKRWAASNSPQGGSVPQMTPTAFNGAALPPPPPPNVGIPQAFMYPGMPGTIAHTPTALPTESQVSPSLPLSASSSMPNIPVSPSGMMQRQNRFSVSGPKQPMPAPPYISSRGSPSPASYGMFMPPGAHMSTPLSPQNNMVPPYMPSPHSLGPAVSHPPPPPPYSRQPQPQPGGTFNSGPALVYPSPANTPKLPPPPFPSTSDLHISGARGLDNVVKMLTENYGAISDIKMLDGGESFAIRMKNHSLHPHIAQQLHGTTMPNGNELTIGLYM